MKAPYEFNAADNIVNICGWHPTRSALEARAAAEHPTAGHSHGICLSCLEAIKADLKSDLSWEEDARAEIAAAYGH